jgi:hydroxyethylthiazole kinase
MDGKELGKLLEAIRSERPMVHHITNYVTVNDCANITMCIGAAPVMAHSVDEVAEMVAMAGALVLNIGTLDAGQIEAMLIAGKRANELKIPVVLDPVGAGATRLRTSSARKLIGDLKLAVIKGNAGEVATLAGEEASVRGVDSMSVKKDIIGIATKFAGIIGTTVAITGKTDIVSDGKSTLLVDNGHQLMGSFSGSGCMAASVCGAFAAVSGDRLKSTVAALAAFGIAGENAARKAKGPGSFKVALFDAVAALTPAELAKRAKLREA